ERGPGWTLAQGAEEVTSCLWPVRELVVRIPAPRGDHGQNQDAAVTEQFFISVRVALADIFGDMGEVELDGPTAACLKIDEQRPGRRSEHVAWLRLRSVLIRSSRSASASCGVRLLLSTSC